MPRNGSGVYSLPGGSLATTGTTVTASTHNTPLNDLVTDANDPRPIVAGGTGGTTPDAARKNLGVLFFEDRSDLITWWGANGSGVDDGVILWDGTAAYKVDSASTDISDASGLTAFGDWKPEHHKENTTPGTTNMNSAISAQLADLADPNISAGSGSLAHPNIRQKVKPWLLGTGSPLYRISAMDDIRLGGVFDQNTSGGRAIGFEGAVNGFVFSGLDIRPSGFGLSIKSGNGTGGWVENGVVMDLKVIGGDTTADVGVTVDGDARNIVFVGGLIKNIQRSDGGGNDGHGFAIAGDAGDAATTNDAENILILGYVFDDINGEVIHIEDAIKRAGLSFCVARNTPRGIEVTNDNVPSGLQFVGNHFAGMTEYFATFAGTGSTENVNLSYSVFDGDGATPTVAYAARVNQNDTKNFNLDRIMFLNMTHTGGAFYSNAKGPFQLRGLIFDGVTNDCITLDEDDAVAVISGSTFNNSGTGIVTTSTARNSPDDLRGVLVKSDNTFEAVTNVVEKANAAGVIGDQRVMSPVLDSDDASNTIMFVAQRKGYLTGVTRLLAAAGGSGASNSTVTLYKTNSGGSTALWSGSIPRTGSQYDAFLWGAENSAITDNTFAAGDVIRLACDGVENASTLFHIQLDFFYYND